LDTVERLLAEREVFDRGAIEAYRPDASAAKERGQWQIDYISRLLRVLQQDIDAMK
jgi:glucuronate isomerase